MTVGISFSHGKRLEAIVITDSRVSQSGRYSDYFNKVGEFTAEDYHGVIFGSGNGTLVGGVLQNLDAVSDSTLEGYVSEIQKTHKEREDAIDQIKISSEKEKIKTKASLHLPEEKMEEIKQNAQQIPEEQREAFIHNEFRRLQQKYESYIDEEHKMVMQKYDQYKQQNPINFILVAYDEERGKVRNWHINQSGAIELFGNHLEIGSGFDGGNMYFAENLQGIGVDVELSRSDLAFFAFNAYNSSSLNYGVGGTPRVALVNEEGTEFLAQEQINVLLNLSGAYLSRFAERRLTRKKVDEYIESVLNREEEVYEVVADILKTNLDTVKSSIIPYNEWQKKANHKFFNRKGSVNK